MYRTMRGIRLKLSIGLIAASLCYSAGMQAQSADPGVDAAGVERFNKGVALAEQNKTERALEVFEQLTRDYPRWPEPYNNLAVLYAARGDEKKAEKTLLSALKTHPSYELVYRNLNSLYAGIAERAYRKALESDERDSPPPKLALATEAASVPAVSGGGSQSVTIIASAAPAAAPAPQATVKVAVAVPEPVVAPQPAAAPEPAAEPEQVAQPVARASAEARPVVSPEAERKRDVLSAVASWLAAWSTQDVNRYLSFYGHHFQPSNGVSRERWEEIRRIRVSKPQFIEVRIADPEVFLDSEDRATVKFLQRYRSDTFSGRTEKTLKMSLGPAGWKIIREQAGG